MYFPSQRLVLSFSLASLLAASEMRAAIVVAGTNLVELYADHPSAGTANWLNTGTLGGSFQANSDPVVTNVGGITYVSMDGDDYYFGPEAPEPVTGSGTRSIEVWTRNDSLDPEETLVSWGRFSHGGTSQSIPFFMGFNYGSSAGFGAANHADFRPALAMGWNVVPTVGELHYLAYTYDRTTARVYADGVERNSMSVSLQTTMVPHFLLHAYYNGFTIIPGTGPSGLEIAVVRIDTGVLSPSDILANFNAGVDARIPEPCSAALLTLTVATLFGLQRPRRENVGAWNRGGCLRIGQG